MRNIILMFLLIVPAQSYTQVKIEEKIISSGVTHKKIINPEDTLSIDILKIDLTEGNYIIRSVKANNLLNARETTSSMAMAFSDSGYNVIAALNADFFESDGEVVNNMLSEGELVKAVKFTDSPFNSFVNSQFAVTYDDRLLIEQFVFSGNIIFPDGSVEQIRRINSKADSNSITLYNSFQGSSTPYAPENWLVIETALNIVNELADTILCKVESEFIRGGDNQILKDGFVLSANGKYAHYLERELSPGDTVKLVLSFNPHYPGIRSLTGGWPLLVKDGINLMRLFPEIEGVRPRFSENRHPRTGIGFSKDSTIVYFITVDGRQTISRGMSLLEFAELMINEGIFQGLNLDGGGSTAMIINNKVVNNPSDATGERAVGNCLLLIRKE